jgi:hypothetical protein
MVFVLAVVPMAARSLLPWILDHFAHFVPLAAGTDHRFLALVAILGSQLHGVREGA